ncbi:MAG: hypothetical protein JNM84_01295 [Planctomycetes bacterium]|nr:hypothetical protein [Planctomycetota bacterium]
MIPSPSVALTVFGLAVLTGCGFAPPREETVADRLVAMESEFRAPPGVASTRTESSGLHSHEPYSGMPALEDLEISEVPEDSPWHRNVRFAFQDEADPIVGNDDRDSRLDHGGLHERDDVEENDEWTFQTGAGFTLDPDMFLIPFVLEARIAEDFYLGPSVQLAHSNSREFLGLGVEGRVELADPVWESDDFFDRVVPFVTGGIGAAYLEKQDRARKDDDWALMLNAGIGAEYRIDEHVSIGSRVVLDWFADDLVGERSMFAWHVVTLRFRF